MPPQARRRAVSSSLLRQPAWVADDEPPMLGLDQPRQGGYFTPSLLATLTALAGSSNGRTPDSESGSLGSSPSPAAGIKSPANRGFLLGFIAGQFGCLARGMLVTLQLNFAGER